MKQKHIVTDSYSKEDYGVSGIGVAFRGGRIICGDIVEAVDLECAELLAVLRAVEIASRFTETRSYIWTDLEKLPGLIAGEGHASSFDAADVALQIGLWLDSYEFISVEVASWDCVRAARIVARQTFKAWRSAFTTGVTWEVPALPVAEQFIPYFRQLPQVADKPRESKDGAIDAAPRGAAQ
jgi:hypothetical protein